MKGFPFRRFVFACAAVLVLVAAGGAYYYHARSEPAAAAAAQYKTPQEASPYVRFDMDVYDIIKANYWQQVQDSDLAQLYQLSLGKALGASTTPALPSADRTGVAQMLAAAMAQATSTAAQAQLAEQVATIALYNLAPAGRSGLLSQQQQTALRDEVSNVHPSTDLYGDLGLAKGASAQDVAQAYAQKESDLKNATSSDAQAELAQAAYADQVLTNTNSKSLYDQAQIEPTVFSRILGKTLYINMTQVSPTSLEEFAYAVDAASTTPGLDSMIVDLRGNIGGALDFTQAFLGLFIGENQYAFDLFHQGDYDVQRTTQPKFDELDRFADIAFLVDNMTQSTAELTTAVFKKFRLAHVVGVTTRGWGTVENTFPIEAPIDPTQTFSVLLVHSITLREDNQPIEGRGVDPDVDTSKAGWQSQLSQYFRSASLIAALKEYATQPPLK
jgi:C-terminal processing protease CtpA/Prc